jgi:hypothetical protein
MLKLNASYSKKVPVQGEDYSSQSYHCSMEVELSDALEPEQIQAKIHDTFAMVRDAVEVELHGSAPKVEQARPPMRVLSQPEAPARGAAPARNSGEKATNKQIKYVLDLAKSRGIGLSEVNARVQKAYGAESVYDLDRKSASRLVDELKAAA